MLAAAEADREVEAVGVVFASDALICCRSAHATTVGSPSSASSMSAMRPLIAASWWAHSSCCVCWGGGRCRACGVARPHADAPIFHDPR